MSEPLDFSSIGKTTAPPPAAKPSGKTPKGKPPKGRPPRVPRAGGPDRSRLVLLVAVIALAVVVGIVLLRSGDDSTDLPEIASTQYCEVATNLAIVIPTPGAGVAAVEPGVLKAKITDFGGLDEWRSTAPADIEGDVDAVAEAVTQAADGNPAALQAASYQEHFDAIETYRARSCPVGAGIGDS